MAIFTAAEARALKVSVAINEPTAVERGDTLEDYDRLPRPLRDVLKYAPRNYSERDVWAGYRYSGMPAVRFAEFMKDRMT